jgi:hypothetical protein
LGANTVVPTTRSVEVLARPRELGAVTRTSDPMRAPTWRSVGCAQRDLIVGVGKPAAGRGEQQLAAQALSGNPRDGPAVDAHVFADAQADVRDGAVTRESGHQLLN